ncbi:MAG: TetR/AcrR family transcriptional regulator [Candidatus Zixiibacteriota bacterium]
MTRKTAERETRQQFILDAAKRLFADKGIENTTMEDIAEASEYTRRTLYAYFTSRDDICLQALIEDMHLRWAEQKLAVADAGTGLAKLVAWAQALYEYVKRNPASIHLQFYWDYRGVNRIGISDEVFEKFEDINTELAKGLIAIFKLGVKDGTIRRDCDINMTISQFLNSYRGILNRVFTPTYSFAEVKADEYVEQFIQIFCRGISGKGDKSL